MVAPVPFFNFHPPNDFRPWPLYLHQCSKSESVRITISSGTKKEIFDEVKDDKVSYSEGVFEILEILFAKEEYYLMTTEQQARAYILISTIPENERKYVINQYFRGANYGRCECKYSDDAKLKDLEKTIKFYADDCKKYPSSDSQKEWNLSFNTLFSIREKA